MKQKKIYPRARWTKWRPHPSRGCFVAGCSLNNHPGGEKKVVHIMQTVDTCMQYWREKIMKIRGQSLSSRFFSLIILITDCPPPFQCHRILANLDPAALFWRNSLWLWIVVEWVCTRVLAEAEDTPVMLCSSSIHYTSMEIFHWKSMQVNTTQLCKHVQVHKCTKNASMCRSEHSSMQRSSPTDWPGPAFAALSPGDHLPLRPTTQSHHNIINKRMCTSILYS